MLLRSSGMKDELITCFIPYTLYPTPNVQMQAVSTDRAMHHPQCFGALRCRFSKLLTRLYLHYERHVLFNCRSMLSYGTA